MLAESFSRVQQRIAQACARVGRDPASVTLVGVTKGVAVEQIREALALGLTDLGENRVQEAREKQTALGSRLKAQGTSFQLPASSLERVRWHLIGHLQRNKAGEAVRLFDVIHSADSLRVIEALEKAQGSRLKALGSGLQPPASSLQPLEVFIQVNISGEATKSGCRPDEAAVLADAARGSPHLVLKGLMTMAPFSNNPEDARPHFRRLRELRDELLRACHSAFRTPHSALLLSMGMSQDFEVAIEEGANFVRIGTAIFG